jgi:hypothetical protein
MMSRQRNVGERPYTLFLQSQFVYACGDRENVRMANDQVERPATKPVPRPDAARGFD